MYLEGMLLETYLVTQQHLANSTIRWLVPTDTLQVPPSEVSCEISRGPKRMDAFFKRQVLVPEAKKTHFV